MKCEIFDCQINVYRRLTIGPGTSTALCEKHYIESQRELLPEDPKQGGKDMVKENTEKAVLEVRLGNVDIPRAGVLADMLQEWVDWVRVYGSLIGVGSELEDLYDRTKEAVKKWGRDG